MIKGILLVLAVLTVSNATVWAQAPTPANPMVAAWLARGQARTAALRRAWLAAGHTPAQDGAAPSISNGTIPTHRINVIVPPAAPAVSMQFQAPSGGLSFIYTLIESAAAPGQILQLDYFPPYDGRPPLHGSVTLQNPYGLGVPNPAALGLYAAPGLYTLVYVMVGDVSGQSTFYSGDQLAAVFAQTSFTVVNNVSPDTVGPTVSAGAIVTPTVSLSSTDPVFRASMTVADGVSGVASAEMVFNGPSFSTGTANAAPPSPLANGSLNLFNVFRSTSVTGTYTIFSYQVCDAANNCTYDSSPADIQTLFGTTTFNVVK